MGIFWLSVKNKLLLGNVYFSNFLETVTYYAFKYDTNVISTTLVQYQRYWAKASQQCYKCAYNVYLYINNTALFYRKNLDIACQKKNICGVHWAFLNFNWYNTSQTLELPTVNVYSQSQVKFKPSLWKLLINLKSMLSPSPKLQQNRFEMVLREEGFLFCSFWSLRA